MAAKSMTPLLLSLVVLLFFSSCSALTPPRRITPVLTVSKDASTNQYVTRLRQKTPSSVLSLVLDLGARYSWVDCENGSYISSTFSYVPCKTKDCVAALSKGCSGSNICSIFAWNPYIRTTTPGDLAQDSITITTTDGFKPVTVPNVTFSCGFNSLLEGLVPGASGMVGLGRTGVSLPSQLSSSLRYPNKFALCLPSAGPRQGVIFFGDAPYHIPTRDFISAAFVYTPLVVNPVSTAGTYFKGERSVEYFIEVSAIKVNGKNVPVNTSLLSITKKGTGGTKLSTVNPYTVLESSIYKAVVDAFARESGLTRVKPVAPFGACFDGKKVRSTWVGPDVPPIELVFGSGASWAWNGANSVVEVQPGVLCLGLIDGGAAATTSVVVGGYQMEDNMLQFDLVGKRFGVTGTLRSLHFLCSYFNVTV